MLGSPIVDANTKHLVAPYAGQEARSEDFVLTAHAVTAPVKLGDLDLEGCTLNAEVTFKECRAGF